MNENAKHFVFGFAIAAVLSIVSILVLGLTQPQEPTPPGTLSVIFSVDEQNEIRYDITFSDMAENFSLWSDRLGEELSGNDLAELNDVLAPYASTGAVATFVELNRDILEEMAATGIPLTARVGDAAGQRNLVGSGVVRWIRKHCTVDPIGKTKSVKCNVSF